MSNSKVWNAFIFIIQCVGLAVLYLLFCIPYLPLILIAGILLIAVAIFWHTLFSAIFGFWPAVVVVILMFGVMFYKEYKNDQYKAGLRAKEMRGEPLHPWEHETIHPKPSAGLSFSDIALGVVLGKLFFGKGSSK